jgi:hypothetical protein
VGTAELIGKLGSPSPPEIPGTDDTSVVALSKAFSFGVGLSSLSQVEMSFDSSRAIVGVKEFVSSAD